MYRSKASFSHADLETIPASELKLFSTVIEGVECNIPAVVKVKIRTSSRAVGISIDGRSETAKMIQKVASRICTGKIDWSEVRNNEPADVISIKNAANRFSRALKKGSNLIVIPPYSFPRHRLVGCEIDASKQFRVVIEKPINGDIEQVVLPAIVPILEDWRHVARFYNYQEKLELVKEMGLHGQIGSDFAVAFGAAVGINREQLLEFSLNREKARYIFSKVTEITAGREIEKIDKIDTYLAIAEVLRKGNLLTIPLDLVRYGVSYTYGVDFGSVLFQKIKTAGHVLSDDELFEELKRFGRYMTFSPLDAFRVQWPRTQKERNMFWNKEPKKVIENICAFADKHHFAQL